ncbi:MULTISPECIES: Ig-like domain-containing protein [Clostridium]|uniref:Ig domain-containing protein n=1 Tax=Clostridium cibarium TaxID=2762247 RepID=A0ABR8PTH6_9CLOT|nr:MULTISPECIES: Ig-like domain-containing protein [Clostridium]MBD7911452.1 Ig domain-containing protein [Clostridium cibarium]
MKNYIKKFSIIFLILFAIIGIQLIQRGTVVSAATVGQQLLQPENGWRRYDDRDSIIQYVGNWWVHYPDMPSFYNATESEGDCYKDPNSKIQFKFQGTKLRIISICNSACSNSINISIDGVKQTFSEYKAKNEQLQTLVYEKNNLNNSIHTVEITNNSTFLCLDAIDIDSTGELKPYNNDKLIVVSGISLNKTTSSLQVGQADNLVPTITPNNATNKNVKWISSDTSVATVDYNGKVIAKKAGTANIMATTTDGSNLSATCVVTVTDTSTTNPNKPMADRAVLTINMSNNVIKTYDLSKDELNAFLNWYDSRSKGTAEAYYILENKPIGGKITNKDYIIYDKIEYFNVQEYKAN